MFYCRVCNTIEYGCNRAEHNHNEYSFAHIHQLGQLKASNGEPCALEKELVSYMPMEEDGTKNTIHLEGKTAGEIARIMYLIKELSK